MKAASGSSAAVGSSRKTTLGLVEHRPGDGQLLLHALAERAGEVVATIPEVEQAQVALDPLGAGGRI